MRYLANATPRAPTTRTAIFAALALAFGVTITTAPAGAQEPAVSEHASREQVIDILGKRYGETPIARGLTETGSMVEVFAAAGGETWTIVMTSPQGVSRIASTGMAWQDVRPPIGKLSNYVQTN